MFQKKKKEKRKKRKKKKEKKERKRKIDIATKIEKEKLNLSCQRGPKMLVLENWSFSLDFKSYELDKS